MRDIIVSHHERVTRLEEKKRQTERSETEFAPQVMNNPVTGTFKPTGRTLKAPQIQSFSGNTEDQNSTEVKSFIYSIKKVGILSAMNEQDTLALADCYLTDAAAKWMMILEFDRCKPTSIESLQSAMMAEFVPADEKIRAKSKMMQMKMDRSVDHYITVFRELIEVTGSPLAMVYAFFSMGLPDEYEEEMSKKYPSSEPATLQEVYDAVRTIERALQFTRKIVTPDRKQRPNGEKPEKPPADNHRAENSERMKDRNAVSWGPAKDFEKEKYRRNRRCFLCGHKWKFGHSCGKDAESKPQEKDPKA